MPLAFPPVVAPHVLAEHLSRGPIRLLDVRTPAEFESVHIHGAYNVPLDRLAEHAAEIRAIDQPVVLVCASGQRARKAEAALQEAGMRQLHVLDGGMSAWIAAGLPVRRGREKMSLERQVRLAAGTLAGAGGLLALAVDPLFALLPAFVGSGLVYSGLTNTCGMALLLARLPYNKGQTCDVGAMVRALTAGRVPE